MVKECFKFLADKIEPYQYPCARLLDIGCGNGDFFRYLSERFPHLLLYGIDTSPKALRQARKTKAIVDLESLYSDTRCSFDVVTMTGVHSEFSSVKSWLPHLLRKGKKDATYFVMGYFNPHPIDVMTTWTHKGKTQFRGFNIPSQKTTLEELKKYKRKGTFEDFSLQIDIPKSHDPTRVWTFKNEEGNRLQTNGACQLIPFKLLTIRSWRSL